MTNSSGLKYLRRYFGARFLHDFSDRKRIVTDLFFEEIYEITKMRHEIIAISRFVDPELSPVFE